MRTPPKVKISNLAPIWTFPAESPGYVLVWVAVRCVRVVYVRVREPALILIIQKFTSKVYRGKNHFRPRLFRSRSALGMGPGSKRYPSLRGTLKPFLKDPQVSYKPGTENPRYMDLVAIGEVVKPTVG